MRLSQLFPAHLKSAAATPIAYCTFAGEKRLLPPGIHFSRELARVLLFTLAWTGSTRRHYGKATPKCSQSSEH
ncbi:hypothetical protein Q1695_006095 [Nippostrongylus brasiliensis]|nr:hypothetical protein Q1695_006095 [Nippostrongylus brasiliensis]